MTTTTVEAIYEQGVLRLKEPMPIPDGTNVRVVVTLAEPANAPDHVDREKTPAEILAEIAAMPLEKEEGVTDVAQNHDKYLYGWDKNTP